MLDAYLDRIAYDRPVPPDEATMFGVHRAHILAIPYENLEIQLGRENVLAGEAFVRKLVHAGRGGWCYEMNGTLTLALRRVGFQVTRVAGAVGRDTQAEEAVGNHMVGLVDPDRRWVVDVGLADGPLEPFPLEEREWSEGELRFRLERLDDGWWRFHNHEHGLASTFDFTEQPRELSFYQDMCSKLQTDPSSPFVQFAIASRRAQDGYQALRDTRHFHLTNGKLTERLVTDRNEYLALLAGILGKDLGPEAGTLWEGAVHRAAARAAAKEAAESRSA